MFHVKVERTPTAGRSPGSRLVSVFDDEERKVGEYVRNYGSYGDTTFCPFRIGDDWFALYSKEYMYTRVMSLPDCRDLGGEDHDNVAYEHHFCPMEYLVPELALTAGSAKADPPPALPNHQPDVWARKVETAGGWQYFYPDDTRNPKYDPALAAEYKAVYDRQHALMKEWHDRHPYEFRHAPFGFVGGCAWGADYGGMFVQLIDLRRAAEGVISRRWGHDMHLAQGLSLASAVHVIDLDGAWGDLDIDDPTSVLFELALPRRVRPDGTVLPDAA